MTVSMNPVRESIFFQSRLGRNAAIGIETGTLFSIGFVGAILGVEIGRVESGEPGVFRTFCPLLGVIVAPASVVAIVALSILLGRKTIGELAGKVVGIAVTLGMLGVVARGLAMKDLLSDGFFQKCAVPVLVGGVVGGVVGSIGQSLLVKSETLTRSLGEQAVALIKENGLEETIRLLDTNSAVRCSIIGSYLGMIASMVAVFAIETFRHKMQS